MDLMRDDIRTTFEENYIGVNNSYDNKMLFIGAVNQYFNKLEKEGILDKEAENKADIDVNAQRKWLAQKYDVSEYSIFIGKSFESLKRITLSKSACVLKIPTVNVFSFL